MIKFTTTGIRTSSSASETFGFEIFKVPRKHSRFWLVINRKRKQITFWPCKYSCKGASFHPVKSSLQIGIKLKKTCKQVTCKLACKFGWLDAPNWNSLMRAKHQSNKRSNENYFISTWTFTIIFTLNSLHDNSEF